MDYAKEISDHQRRLVFSKLSSSVLAAGRAEFDSARLPRRLKSSCQKQKWNLCSSKGAKTLDDGSLHDLCVFLFKTHICKMWPFTRR